MKRYHLNVYETIRFGGEPSTERDIENKSFTSLKELLVYLKEQHQVNEIEDTDVHSNGSVELTAAYTKEFYYGFKEVTTTYLIDCTQTISIELSENEREDINEILTGTALC